MWQSPFADERLLVARIVNDHVNLRAVAAHAPHNAIDEEDRSQWWNHLRAHMPNLPEAHTFVLLDAIGVKSGSTDDRTVFEHGDEESLEACELCLPSTTGAHQGEHNTWHHPSGEWASRLDYVCVPQTLRHGCAHCRVMEDFDLATAHHDHCAVVGLELQWMTAPHQIVRNRGNSRVIQRSQIKHCNLSEALESQYHCHWQQDIETQVNNLNSVITQALAPKTSSSNRSREATSHPPFGIYALRRFLPKGVSSSARKTTM